MAIASPLRRGCDPSGDGLGAWLPGRRRTSALLPLSQGLAVRRQSIASVAQRALALALLFVGAALWHASHSLFTGAELAPELPAAPELVPASQPVRRLDIAGDIAQLCPSQNEDVGLLTVSSSHVSKSETYNHLCSKGGSVCLKEGNRWMILLYVAGILYMFVGLAIVCDEFFVPSLEYFCDDFEITPDIAGATFMAAGGSMPELFTSFIGTFKGNSVGIAAIVGSAVFNVLFVIATCAIASKHALDLTWWPLARDSSYYLLTLVSLALFFSGPWSKNEIELWEAAIMFLEYFGYCIMMKYNERLHSLITGPPHVKVSEMKVHPVPPEVDTQSPRVDVEKGEDLPPPRRSKRIPSKVSTDPNFRKPSSFRQGIMQLVTQNEQIADTVGMSAVMQLKGDLRETWAHVDADQDGLLDETEFKNMLEEMGLSPDSTAMDTIRHIGRNTQGKITFEEFERWYMASEARIEIKLRTVFEEFDANGNGFIEEDEVWRLLKSLGHCCTQEEAKAALATCRVPNLESGDIEGTTPPDNNLEEPDKSPLVINFEEFSRWYTTTLFWKQQERFCQAEGAMLDGGLSLELPTESGKTGKLWFVATYPLCAMMYITMPDVRRERTRSIPMAVIEFLISLFWIGLFSICLVEWTEVVSNTIGVPLPVSAITILAAGTSIPDLLSSYIVAKQGFGDMAVSSSIGSNIFDVTVGLPLPWLIWSIANKGSSVLVDASGIGFFITLLVVMIAAVVVTVMLMKWRMNKCMGYIMFILYFLFILLFLLVQMPEADPVMTVPF